MSGIIIAIELVALYLLSRRLTQNLYIAVFLLTKSRPVAISFLSVLFFPGTVIHELAHLFTAEILGVRTGGLTLVPEGLEEKSVRTGSVMISQTDPIRRAVIGIAPVFAGLLMIGTLSFFLPDIWFRTTLDIQNGLLLSNFNGLLFLLMVYALFAVSNTMFSSPEDLEGFWPVVIVLLLLGIAGFIMGVRITLTGPVLESITTFMVSVATNVGYVTGLNVVLFACSLLLIRLMERITKRRLVVKP